MLKKICVIGMTLCMLFGVTACGSNSNSSSGGKSNTTTQKESPFTESKGLIKYFKIDDEKNDFRGEFRLISTDDSKIPVYVVPTDEELMIAKDTYFLVK